MYFYLITTDHLEDRLWFRDEEDFKTGMNYAATVAFLAGVNILAFILMSNHVHFVLECSGERARAFITEYKRLYSHYLSTKYRAAELLRRNSIDIQRLEPGDESLERAIAYVQMNCVAANICMNPADYRWGTGSTFFQPAPGMGRPLGSFSRRAQIRMLHSRVELPSDWTIGEEGYVLPGAYVGVRFVERLFRTPKRMNYFLVNSSKAKRRLALKEEGLPSFRDQVILAAIPDLCRTLFHQQEVADLNGEQQSVLVSQIRRRFSSDINQIARVTGIPLSDAARMLEGF
jgi:hypothetical protein